LTLDPKMPRRKCQDNITFITENMYKKAGTTVWRNCTELQQYVKTTTKNAISTINSTSTSE